MSYTNCGVNTRSQGRGESIPNTSLKIVLLFDCSGIQAFFIKREKHPPSSNISTIIIGLKRTVLYSQHPLQEIRNIWFSREFFQHHYLSYIKFGYPQLKLSWLYLLYHQLKIFNSISFVYFIVQLVMLCISSANYNSMFRLYK